MAVPHKKNTFRGFEPARAQLLESDWCHNVQDEDTREFLAALDDTRWASCLYKKKKNRPYLQPRGGFPTFAQQHELTRHLADAGADFIPLTIDSYTRHNEYEQAAHLLEQSEDKNKDFLNGYPLLCHGVHTTRNLYKNINQPVCLRHGTPDARMLVEVALASGLTEIEGGGLSYCIPYAKSFPLEQAVLHWQYVDRLCAHYSTKDKPIHRESFGPLTGTMVPPVITIAVQLIEMLLAVEQGITSFSVGFGQTGSLVQDLAVGRLLQELPPYYLDRFGFEDVDIHMVYHQWMGAFPEDRDHAACLISNATFIAQLIGADKLVVKTRDEALGIPTIKSNALAVQTTRYVLEHVSPIHPLNNPRIEREQALIRKEVNALMNALLELPGDVFWESVCRACRRGLIDVPFAPHATNANELITLRDSEQAIRIYNPGKLPLSKTLLDEEQELLGKQKSDHPITIDQMLQDINLMV